MTDTELTAAIVGCGPRGHSHARAYTGITGVELVACADIDARTVDSFARHHAIPHRYTDVARLMRGVRPALVNIVTPPRTHRAVVDQVLDHRPAAVLLEKPVALVADDAAHIVDRCRSEHVALFVNHQLRYFRPMRDLRTRIASGAIGTVHTVRASTRCDVLEQGTHLFDLVSFLLGDDTPATGVFATAAGVQREGPTTGTAAYLFGVATLERDIRLYFECGAAASAWPGNDNPWHQLGVELVGDRGVAGVSLNRGWWVRARDEWHDVPHVHEHEDDPAQRRLITELVMALDDPDAHPCGPRGTRFSSRLAFAALRSARHGRWTPEPPTELSIVDLTTTPIR